MTSVRNSLDDVIREAGRLFAERGYHGTSMRDLGKALGLRGSSLYSHVASKEDLLVDVVERGASLFNDSAARALATEGTSADRLHRLIAGHVDVVIDHLDEARTFLNEARSLDQAHRRKVIEARNRYEEAFRTVLSDGSKDGSFRSDVDPKIGAIFILSVLNSVERWYHPQGRLSRGELVEEIHRFVIKGLD